jgi:hypothetical protein
MIFFKKTMLKTALSVAALGLFSTFFIASGKGGGNKPAAVVETRMSPRFDYTPPSKAEKCGITLALVKPKFAKNFEYSDLSPFSEFAKNMGNDYEELLTSKGYALRGPFASRDEMVFNDKDQSNLVLEPSIEVMVNISNLKSQQVTNFKSSTGVGYRATGQITLTGQFSFVLLSPKRNEKVWVKTLPLDNKTIMLTSKTTFDAPPSFTDLMRDDVTVFNEVSKALESYYPATLDLGWRFLEPAELKQFSADSKKADGGN